MKISGKQLVRIDRLFVVLNKLMNLLPSPAVRSAETNPVLVIKFMGIGSITRWISLCEEYGIDKSRIILLTFSRHQELCELFGLQAWYIRTGSFYDFFSDCWGAMRKTANLHPSWIVDYERCSQSVSVFRKVLVWRGRSRSIAFESAKNKSTPDEQIYSSEELTLDQLMLIGIGVIPKIPLTPRAGNTVKIYRNKVLVNINASDYLLARRYKGQAFIDVVKSLHQFHRGLEFYFTGSSTESEYVESVIEKFSSIPVYNTCGSWSFEKLIRELSECAVFITGDSGPLHLAAYLGIPVIALWGPTQPEHFGYQHNSNLHHLTLRLGCSPCFKHPASKPAVHCKGQITCLRNLTPATIVEKAVTILASVDEHRQVHFPPGMQVRQAKVETSLAS